ncbi:MAG TPA: transposase [Planctomicrobium sp.]|nr:transposase [Planctomicrobium sp.]
MSDYRRWYLEGGTYFFTVVTQDRQPLFADPYARMLLRQSVRSVLQSHPFKIIAIVLLPDHLHTIWSLPRGDHDFSTRWQRIKTSFSFQWLRCGGMETDVSAARKKRGARGVWQRRFWEHLIRDERDLESHFDYIHFNPVKHGLVQNPWDWEWSSFRKYLRLGHYPAEWGRNEPDHIRTLDLE